MVRFKLKTSSSSFVYLHHTSAVLLPPKLESKIISVLYCRNWFHQLASFSILIAEFVVEFLSRFKNGECKQRAFGFRTQDPHLCSWYLHSSHLVQLNPSFLSATRTVHPIQKDPVPTENQSPPMLPKAKDNAKKYDIEELTGMESEVIEMDLMLGVADLHTPEAVAVAESAVSIGQPLVPLNSDSSESESEATSDDDENDEADNDSNIDSDDEDKILKHKTSNSAKDDSSQAVGTNESKKRPKIVEM